MATVNPGFETIDAVRTKAQDGCKRFCGAETTSGSICRAAPMANGLCVQHGGQPRLSAYLPEADLDVAGLEGISRPPDVSRTIDRTAIELEAIESLVAELPLGARQQLVPDVRVLAARALGLYNRLLDQNRSEATTKVSRAAAG